MITIVHGGQTGVDRGAHDAATAYGWRIDGYMTRDGRDELGKIPPDVARHLKAHTSDAYAARTEANVSLATAILIVVADDTEPCATPGTAKTIDLAAGQRKILLIVDTKCPAVTLARRLYDALIAGRTLTLPFEGEVQQAPRLMVAGPRESKWPGAQAKTAALLLRVGHEISKIACTAPISALSPQRG